jgi:hypothetical protein
MRLCELCLQTVISWSQTLINLCIQLVGDHCLVSVEEQDRLKQNPEEGKADHHMYYTSLPSVKVTLRNLRTVCDHCFICKIMNIQME